MKTWLTTFALCAAVPLALDSVSIPLETPEVTPTIRPDFSVIKQDHTRAYVERIYPLAQQLRTKHQMPLVVSIGIACLESGYGRSHYARHRNNHLGIRTYQSGKADYRRFSSLEDCFGYFGQLLDSERYAPLQALDSSDLPAYLAGLQACGFNHRDSYYKKLLTVIEFLNLHDLEPKQAA